MPRPPQVDLFDPVFKANPYPIYAKLRSSAPIHHIAQPDGRGVWLITRYEDVLAIFKDKRFVKD
jgi:cytochrome P450